VDGVGVAEEHPFRAAWRVRDLDAWIDALAPDVVLHSPVVRAPFRGRGAAHELYGVLFETFGEVNLIGEFADGESHTFFWRAEVSGRTIEGVDLLRHDTDGQIAEITVLIRPMTDIAVFSAAVGPRLAAKSSPARGILAGLLTRPLVAILALADAVASRLIGLR
jgi:hypothetical protein